MSFEVYESIRVVRSIMVDNHQTAVHPPSTVIEEPVMFLAKSLQR